MLAFGGQTENSTHIRDILKTETPQLNKTKRKLGLRDLNIQHHVPVQAEIKQPSKVLLNENVYEEARENFYTYEDKDDYGDLHTRLASISSLVDGVISLSCMNRSTGFMEFPTIDDRDEVDPSDFEIPDSEFNTIFGCLG
ncbi:unnamed protein product [Schistosoma turkestanicum]|nr:unnamed protein product [Schistosoma turkestanicum]